MLIKVSNYTLSYLFHLSKLSAAYNPSKLSETPIKSWGRELILKSFQ